jgi:hypothetical protein
MDLNRGEMARLASDIEVVAGLIGDLEDDEEFIIIIGSYI